eukprot:gnl/MRDRNA2_/MRDRNA2_64957_c0_seq1.p1 gnl/MRDRNA2_/MRDRNA2_64957_c0~~gnl/MRDRNA2_/MRDRNA2_64957_c0_seq1.p1  ORF type:complete len:674 (+),score=94.57 gnl/MRDRNA2_/MRDRNA2_64957_c0_seq1:66-2024(+)
MACADSASCVLSSLETSDTNNSPALRDRVVPKVKNSSPGMPGKPQTAMEKLQADIIHQIELRHSSLLTELRVLREEMLGAITGINGSTVDDFRPVQPSGMVCCYPPSNAGANEIKSQGFLGMKLPGVKLPTPRVDGLGGQSSARHLSNGVSAPELPSKIASTKSTKSASKKDAKVAFGGRPNLKAFMQAKNWDSQTIVKFQENLHSDNPLQDDEAAEVLGDDLHPCMRRLKQLVHSSQFDLLVCCAIFMNSITMALSLEYQGEKTGGDSGLVSYDESRWPNAEGAFSGFEYFFTIFFLIELIIRLVKEGKRYFDSKMNWMDFFIVCTTVLDVLAGELVGTEFPNLTFMRLLRLSKLTRVLRVVRILSFFDQLRVLLAAIGRAMPALAWSLGLLGILQCVGAIFMTQSLQPWLKDEGNALQDREQIYYFFGTFVRAFMTMFEITLAPGTWGRCGRVVIHQVGSYYMLFFLVYLSFVSFTIMSVIRALFLKETLSAAARDSEIVMAEMNRDPRYLSSILKIFNEIDTNGNGIITTDELDHMVHDEGILYWLKQLGLNAHEVKGVFVLMDDGDDEITFAEFVSGIMRLKNASKGVDLATLLYENKKVLSRVLRVGDKVDRLSRNLGHEDNTIPTRGSVLASESKKRRWHRTFTSM